MNPFVVIGCFVALCAILALLGQWQRRITESHEEAAKAEIREAQDRGTHRPLAQHPQIDVQTCIGCGACVDACPEDGVLGLVDGVARVIHGARCIGHGRCEVVCPVGAIKVGLGDLARSPDLPLLDERCETSVPGLFIAGELGGFALIRIAVEQGTRVVQEIARELRSSPRAQNRGEGRFDLLIVGAGPAGLAASLKSKELGLRALVIDQDDVGGLVRKYPRRKLTLTGPLVMPLHGLVEKEEFLKEELIEFWEELIREHALEVRTGVRLQGLEGQRDNFIARTTAGPIHARRVALAIGRRGTPRRLGVPGEEAEKVLYQLLDAASYEGTKILVVGGGDSAIEAATALASQTGNSVTLSYRRKGFFRLKARNEERIGRFAKDGKVRVIFESIVERIESGSVTLHRGQEKISIENDYVFILAGGDPPHPLLRSMRIRFNGDDATGTPASQTTLAEAAP